MEVFLALIFILVFYLMGVLLSAILIIGCFSLVDFLNKKLKLPIKTITDYFWFSSDAILIKELNNCWFSWISFVGIIGMTTIFVVIGCCNGLIKTIIHKMTPKDNGIWFKGFFYKMYIPLTTSYNHDKLIRTFNEFKYENIETNAFLKFTSVVPFKEDQVLILINNKPWKFMTTFIMQDKEQLLNNIEMEIRYRKLKKLHI